MNTINSFALLFFIRKERANKNGEVPIYLRITVNGKISEISLNRRIAATQWDSAATKLTGTNPFAKQTNGYLDTVKAKILKHHQELLAEGEQITSKNLKNKYLGFTESTRTVLETFKYHNEQIKKLEGKDFAPATVQRYETTLNHLKEFIKKKYKISDIPLNQLKYSFIEDFEFYLKTERMCANNTAVKYNKNFKKIINMAVRYEWLSKDPFANYKSKLNEVIIEFLTTEELKIIEEKEFDIPRVDIVRDIFVFSCYTGLAFTDLNSLTIDEIKTENDGTLWIRKPRKKTSTVCSIPLLEKPLKIIEKYKDHPLTSINRRVLPKISNQKMNSYLKEIADVCGIKKPLRSHIGRHTFATTITLSNGVPIEVVSKMLGHSTITMTQKYAKVVENYVKSEMKKLNGI